MTMRGTTTARSYSPIFSSGLDVRVGARMTLARLYGRRDCCLFVFQMANFLRAR